MHGRVAGEAREGFERERLGVMLLDVRGDAADAVVDADAGRGCCVGELIAHQTTEGGGGSE